MQNKSVLIVVHYAFILHLYFVRSNSKFCVRPTARVISLRGFFRGTFGNYNRFSEIIRHLPLRVVVACGLLLWVVIKRIVIVASCYSWPVNACSVARLVAIYVV